MMKKWLLGMCCVFAFEVGSEVTPFQTEVDAIEEEIQVLQTRLHQDRVNEMKEEVKGQGLMIADWNSYARELEKIRKQEEEDKEIQLKIKQLKERKARLIQSSQPK